MPSVSMVTSVRSSYIFQDPVPDSVHMCFPAMSYLQCLWCSSVFKSWCACSLIPLLRTQAGHDLASSWFSWIWNLLALGLLLCCPLTSDLLGYFLDANLSLIFYLSLALVHHSCSCSFHLFLGQYIPYVFIQVLKETDYWRTYTVCNRGGC